LSAVNVLEEALVARLGYDIAEVVKPSTVNEADGVP